MIRVWVYWNLHKKCFSVQHQNKVIMHTDQIILFDAEFRVRESGRQRVLREKCKTVHAFIIGIYDLDNTIDIGVCQHKITYNPYKYNTFVFSDTEESVYNADLVSCYKVNNKPLILI